MSTITLNVDSRFENLVKGMGMSVAQALKELMDRSVKSGSLSISKSNEMTTEEELYSDLNEDARAELLAYISGKRSDVKRISSFEDIDRLVNSL